MELEDTALLAKLAPGDMIALEAKYHSKCLQHCITEPELLFMPVLIQMIMIFMVLLLQSSLHLWRIPFGM